MGSGTSFVPGFDGDFGGEGPFLLQFQAQELMAAGKRLAQLALVATGVRSLVFGNISFRGPLSALVTSQNATLARFGRPNVNSSRRVSPAPRPLSWLAASARAPRRLSCLPTRPGARV